MNTIGIDMSTKHAKKLATHLRKLASVEDVQGPFLYHQDENLCQLHVTTSFTESGLDDWLYRVNHGCDYVGTFVIGEAA